jgi:hypothetical protein
MAMQADQLAPPVALAFAPCIRVMGFSTMSYHRSPALGFVEAEVTSCGSYWALLMLY